MAGFKCRYCGHSEEVCQGKLVQVYVSCLGCRAEIAEAAGYKCRWYGMCHSIYCGNCKKDGLNVWGYCKRWDHSINGCQGCGKQAGLKLGDEQLCVNQYERKCQRPSLAYCLSCSKRLFDKSGQCPYCADKKVLSCVSCNVLFFASDMKACRGDCKTVYCPQCRHKLDGRQYCTSCSKKKCSGCERFFDIDDLVRCSAPSSCLYRYCDKCRQKFMANGICAACTYGSKPCGLCGTVVFANKVRQCRNCQRLVCVDCGGTDKRCAFCHDLFCKRCIQECKKCRKSACLNHCASELCKDHIGFFQKIGKIFNK